MRTHNHKPESLEAVSFRTQLSQAALAVATLALVAASAIVVKELRAGDRRGSPAAPLAMLDSSAPASSGAFESPEAVIDPLTEVAEAVVVAPDEPAPAFEPFDPDRYEADTSIRWFGGRPVRPVREIWMTVTAYSPDWRSCGDSADDITASNHHVQTNSYQLVAADSRVLPLGSMISIPGYAGSRVVPVLDRGGKIKGNRLDVLFPTHEEARKWGVKKLRVVVWGYADGKGKEDWRRTRDGR
ncbi:MAG: 3D domain-containing protein [Phycisphaerales bacterium]